MIELPLKFERFDPKWPAPLKIARTTAPDWSQPLVNAWPGIQLYYSIVINTAPENRPEKAEHAAARLAAMASLCAADTLILDLEDGCKYKTLSREILAHSLPQLKRRAGLQIAIRINAAGTKDYLADLHLLADIAPYIDIVMLAKAGSFSDTAELTDISTAIARMDHRLTLQPIIEHPRALKNASAILHCPNVKHVVFGIHDFSKAMGISITTENWANELAPYFHLLLLDARIAGCGVIAGVDTLIGNAWLPEDYTERAFIQRWLKTDADEAARVVYKHAREACHFGATGKQVIHPSHLQIARAAFIPSPREIALDIEMLRCATEGQIWAGGAMKFAGRMIDRPMLDKALQTLLRADAFAALTPADRSFCAKLMQTLPAESLRESWPYGDLRFNHFQ